MYLRIIQVQIVLEVTEIKFLGSLRDYIKLSINTSLRYGLYSKYNLN